MDNAEWFVACLALVFAINLMPAFMPSTWMVLAFFHIHFDLPLIPLCVSGALVSGFGRFFLAQASGFVTDTFFKKKRDDLKELGAFLEERKNFLAGVTFLYALTPLPTNNLFVAAGMVGVSLRRVLAGFWAARIPADLFWVWSTSATFGSLKDVFERNGNWLAIVLQAGALSSIVLLYEMPWGKWLNKYLRGRSKPGAGRRSPRAAVS
jgi:hypothetical protein